MPDLLKPFLVILRRDDAQDPRTILRCPIATRFSLHQNKLNVIFYDRVRLVRFSKKTSPVFDLVRGVGNFVPDDWRQVIEADLSAMLLNRGVKWHDRVTPFVLAA